MRYCRIQLDHQPAYGRLETRGGEEWITDLLDSRNFAESGYPEVGSRAHRDHSSFKPLPIREATLLAPVTPSKIVCVGRNYRDHATELGNDIPKEPLLFLKPPSSILAPGGLIVYPALSKRVDFEGELAIVIGRRARKIRPDEDVRPYIRGYTLVNDVTARDLQKSDGQWTRGKGFDTFCPAGPWVSDEIDPIAAGIDLETHLNGVKMQSGNTSDFLFDIPALLRSITAFLTLEPGDLIPTGTPAGVGPMQPGDQVKVSATGLGSLENVVVADDPK